MLICVRALSWKCVGFVCDVLCGVAYVLLMVCVFMCVCLKMRLWCVCDILYRDVWCVVVVLVCGLSKRVCVFVCGLLCGVVRCVVCAVLCVLFLL